MKSCSTNDVAVYNLSASKSLPEWLPDRKRRALLHKDVEFKKRVELIQDFEMPGVSTNLKLTPDGNYLLATGIYKPRVRCFDFKNLSMKFERCFDSEVVQFMVLSDDYSKLVFLQSDRFIEFHAQYGKYYRLRIPKFGRDLAYHSPSCDLYIAGAAPEIFRINLELGRFMTPLVSKSLSINKVVINPVHNLIFLGTDDGHVDVWDPRSGKNISNLDIAARALSDNASASGLPSVSSLSFKDGLKLGVGTSTGQVLLYDIRSHKPLLWKDHYYSLPILKVQFQKSENMVFSMDSKIIKIWEEETGEPYTAVEGEADLNDLCLVPEGSMFFAATETQKMLSFFIPSLGPAPKWCSFLDYMAEELEEADNTVEYDDYKFVTERELNELGLEHLIGTNLLRAYMHGYFMDMRLYRKARSIVQPFEFKEFKKNKIRQKLEEERSNRVKLNMLPKVNKDLALKMMTANSKLPTALNDERFKPLFENPDFEIDKNADEYRLLNPIIATLDKKTPKAKLNNMFQPVDGENGTDQESSEDFFDSSSEDEEVQKKIRLETKKIRNEKLRKMQEDREASLSTKLYEFKNEDNFKISDLSSKLKRPSKVSLGERISTQDSSVKIKGPLGCREMIFQTKSKKTDNSHENNLKHILERKKLRRSAGVLSNKKRSWKK